jgi:uncharacterized protein
VQVLYEPNLAEIDAALRSGNNRDIRIVAIPGLNHLFQSARTGSPAKYDSLPDIFSQTALEIISTWITAHTVAK